MGKSDELVKYMTERFVKYIDTPKDVRRQVRLDRKVLREPWEYRWFGMIPFSIRMWADKWRREKEK
ncbi:YqzE family protein [Paenibacillus sp. YYML68]|uniref:YqzE family protein n=1 Tax=Paenibacillus sp. YYML68 TaxID=2909250 RepID=UPI002491C38C|nr:YqzE family protein [Paenibacillus sp. YYML68]